jgi:hypothetical protein
MPDFKREIAELGEQLREMRDSTAAVRGPAFANLVIALFELLSMQELLGRASTFAPPEIARQMVDEMTHLNSAVAEYLVSGMNEEMVAEATKMADAMCERQHQLHERILAASSGDSGG